MAEVLFGSLIETSLDQAQAQQVGTDVKNVRNHGKKEW